MTSICFYFQVHQPDRLRRMQCFRQPTGLDYWDDVTNKAIMDRAADKCYLPANKVLLDQIERTDGRFRVAFSMSGVFLEQAERFRPDVIRSFQELVRTGAVEILDETYHHSLASLWEDQEEFREQVRLHRAMVQRLFGVTPTVFRNTELIYDDRIAHTVADMGYQAILTEGTHHVVGDRSNNHLYRPATDAGEMRVLLKNYKLSDDVAFRFSNHDWPEHPLTADKYANWLADTPGDTINLFMDYETFGEHQWPETGIFQFLEHLPGEVERHPHLGFALPSEVAAEHTPVGQIEVPHAVSWADTERDVSAWLGNKMQHHAFEMLKGMEADIKAADDPELLHTWRKFQTSDHLYYMCTKWMGDGDVHQYFSPYDSPYIGFINMANALEDLQQKKARLVYC